MTTENATEIIGRGEARRRVLNGEDLASDITLRNRYHRFLDDVGEFEHYDGAAVDAWVRKNPLAGSVTPDAPDLRQAAIAAAVTAFTEAPIGPIISDTSNLESAIEDAVAAAFARVAEGLYIAPDRHGISCVWTDDGHPVMAHIGVGPSERLWALLAAVIPPGHDHAQDQEDGS